MAIDLTTSSRNSAYQELHTAGPKKPCLQSSEEPMQPLDLMVIDDPRLTPNTLCMSPSRCQSKMRMLRKTLKKCSMKILCAKGLEVVGDFYIDLLIKHPKRSPAHVGQSGAQERHHVFPREPSPTEQLKDWKWSPGCVFCPETGNVPLFSPPGKTMQGTTADSFINVQGDTLPTTRQLAFSAVAAAQNMWTPVIPERRFEDHVAQMPKRPSQKVRPSIRRVQSSEPKNSIGSRSPQLPPAVVERSASVRESVEAVTGSSEGRKRDVTSALKKIISRHLTEKRHSVRTRDATAFKDDKESAQRNKRGRYRQYNKDDLDEALKAVKKGAMTIHRAGHLYGIPHSTLEYKIKERALNNKNDSSKSAHRGEEGSRKGSELKEPEESSSTASSSLVIPTSSTSATSAMLHQQFPFPFPPLLTLPFAARFPQNQMSPLLFAMDAALQTHLTSPFLPSPSGPFRPWTLDESLTKHLVAPSPSAGEPLNLAKEPSSTASTTC